jgi:Tfp pilus assembly protein PilO
MEKLLETFFRIPKLYRILAVVGLCLLLMVGFYFLFISDMVAQISDLDQGINRIKTEIINQERMLQEGPKLKAQIQELEQRLQSMVASLPEKQEIDVLLKTITNLMSETNLVAKRFVPGQEQKDEELYYAKIPISMSVRGDYRRQGNFFTSLNSLPRIINVPTLKMGPAGGLTPRESDLARKLNILPLDVEITGETYRRLSPEEIKAIVARKHPPKGAPARPGKE